MSYTSGGGDNLDVRERLDTIERGDSFAPATVEFICGGTITVPPNTNYIFPISSATGLRGRVFEFLFPQGELRIKQGGVFGFVARVTGEATGPGNFLIIMDQGTPPYHYWELIGMPFNNQPFYLAYTAGGTRFVDIPQDGASYRVRFSNVGGTGSFVVYAITVYLVYLGIR